MANSAACTVKLSLLSGQVTALIGANGAGKSTLLHQFAQQQNPKYCALFQQETVLAFALTVTEYVSLGRLPWRKIARPQENHDAVEWALSCCGISPFRARSVLALSGGERTKVRLARSLAQLYHPNHIKHDPVYWLLDEADAHLDVRQKHLLGELCRVQAEAGWAVGVVSHDLAWVRAYSDQICAVRALNITQMGETAHILANIPPNADFWL